MINLAFVFSTTVLVTTISTLVLAIAAYFAYKLREWRKPKPKGGAPAGVEESTGPIFLNRYTLSDKAPDDLSGNAQ